MLAVLHDPAYRQANAGALRMEWPRIPLPGWPELSDIPVRTRIQPSSQTVNGKALCISPGQIDRASPEPWPHSPPAVREMARQAGPFPWRRGRSPASPPAYGRPEAAEIACAGLRRPCRNVSWRRPRCDRRLGPRPRRHGDRPTHDPRSGPPSPCRPPPTAAT